MSKFYALTFSNLSIMLGLLISSPSLAHETAPLPIPDSHGPAGVMNDHMHKAGEWMLGYRHMVGFTGSDTLDGDTKIDDQALANKGYSMRTDSMVMHMGMLDIMYAPTNWLNLMLMPQFTYMSMDMAALPAATNGAGSGHGGHSSHSAGHSHTVTGLGDTIGTALIRLHQDDINHVHLGLGLSAPTGNVWERMGGKMQHYGMQLGSGTWDFVPSLTYTGQLGRYGWGAQATLTTRLEDENDAGYQLGDSAQTTVWGSYRWLDWLSTSLRGQYFGQQKINGHYKKAHNHSSPPDLQANYGGHFFDVGFGINMVASDGQMKGTRLGVEWLQPVYDNVNGYQAERTGSLFISVSKAF